LARCRSLESPPLNPAVDPLVRTTVSMPQSQRVFRIEERFERDGALRLLLIGELDVAVIELVSSRLRELHKSGYGVRLDLSRLTFIDSSGIQEIFRDLEGARQDGWELEVDGPLTETVARTFDLLGARPFLWPEKR
jgi:anti-anti-sigma factor